MFVGVKCLDSAICFYRLVVFRRGIDGSQYFNNFLQLYTYAHAP